MTDEQPRPRHTATPASHADAPSIVDFVAPKSLESLCAAAERLLGAPVTVLGAGEVAAATGRVSAPIRVNDQIVGAFALAESNTPGTSGAIDEQRRATAERFLALLATVIEELCGREAELRDRVDELGVLYRLSSMLVGVAGAEAMLETGLRSAIELLGVDAGTVRLLDEQGASLRLAATEGLSDEYLKHAGTLPASEAFDHPALEGEAFAIDDLMQYPAAVSLDRIRAEGLKSMLSAGLVFRGQPMGILRLYTRTPRHFTRPERGLLQSIGQQIAAAVANARLLESQAKVRHVREQMRLARDIQRRMLPRAMPRKPALDVAAVYESCFDLGGDFYDVYDDGEKIGLIVGDVVGKGVPAALMMASVRSSLRAFAQPGRTLDEAVALTNQAMCRDTQLNEFATLFCGVIDPASLRLTYCNAGHEPPLVVRVPEHRAPCLPDVDELSIGGMVAGVDPSQRYQVGSVDLRPGDVLMAYTDGLSEAMNFQMKRFGRQRVRESLLNILAARPGAGAQEIAAQMLWEMRRYVGLQTQSDDVTIVVARATGKA